MEPRDAASLMTTLVIDVAIGVVGAFIVFLFAYGFADQVTPLMHVVFLVGYLAVAAVAALASGAALRSSRPTGGWDMAMWTTAAAYLAALGAGTIVSLAHEDDGSVTAQQPDAPFIVLVALCFVGAIAAVRMLVRTLTRP